MAGGIAARGRGGESLALSPCAPCPTIACASVMSPPGSEPPPSDSDPALGASGDPPKGNPEAPANDTSPPALPREIIADFLSRPLTHQWVKALVRRRVASRRVEDVCQDILLEAIETKSVPSVERALPQWLKTIALRVIADYHTKRVRRARYEASREQLRELENARERDADGESPDDEGLEKLTYDPTVTMSFGADGFLIRPWLERQVQSDPRDKETLALILERAGSEKTYAKIAEEHGMTLTALSARIFQFKKKYLPHYKRDRNRVFVLLLLAGAALLVLAWWVFLRGGAQTNQDRIPPAPGVVPSASTPSVPRPAPRGLFEPEGVGHPRPEGDQ
jgi:DNA-directed RNA polymerase specialized sigma24 family protein